ncbi:MAG: hypothetical protein JXA73_16275 [Acidobacteria bacterium]|nr:hypothetical protein [Acidobacteriota bacterium]
MEEDSIQPEWVEQLSDINLAPYICKGRALIGKPRKTGDNMFRHQMMTLAVLLDYRIIDSVLLKTAVIHDIAEDAAELPYLTRGDFANLDDDGEQVYDLMMEVTVQKDGNGKEEPKSEFLSRIMKTGSHRARILKLADRINNLISLGWVHEREFIERTLAETREYILPYAREVSEDMDRELRDLIASREQNLQKVELKIG